MGVCLRFRRPCVDFWAAELFCLRCRFPKNEKNVILELFTQKEKAKTKDMKMSYFNSLDYQINLMLDHEQDLQDDYDKRLQEVRDGIGDYVLLPEGDPWKLEDYEQNPQPSNVNDTCGHGFYVTEGLQTGTMYHLNPDLALWVACDDYEDIGQMVREGKRLTQPIDDSMPEPVRV